jgi:hypothetical protein
MQDGSKILRMHTTLLLNTISVLQISFLFDFVPLYYRQADSYFWNIA